MIKNHYSFQMLQPNIGTVISKLMTNFILTKYSGASYISDNWEKMLCIKENVSCTVPIFFIFVKMY